MMSNHFASPGSLSSSCNKAEEGHERAAGGASTPVWGRLEHASFCRCRTSNLPGLASRSS